MLVASGGAHVDAAAMSTGKLTDLSATSAVSAIARVAPVPQPRSARAAQHAASLLAGLTALFACRVAAQAIQRWLPQSILPPFAAFQGSSIPYGLLLAVQILLLVLMTSLAWRVRTGGMSARPVLAAWLEIAGTIYFGAMFLRLVIGLSVPLAPAWFSATIPAFFHLVLAAYILVLAGYLRPAPNAIGAEDIP